MSGKLYLVPTPIGNLEDITLRAIRILKEVDIVLAEDTRVTRKLLQHLGINQQMYAHHQHNEHKAVAHLVERMAAGETMALVSDAGSPGISDPGFLLVREAINGGITVESLPGPTAFVPALVASGLPCDRFVYEGFLPQKKGRQTRIKALIEEPRTMVFYESPHRLVKFLGQLAAFLGEDRKASVARELTKVHEEHRRGTLTELIQHYTDHPPKGEIAVVVAGKS